MFGKIMAALRRRRAIIREADILVGSFGRRGVEMAEGFSVDGNVSAERRGCTVRPPESCEADQAARIRKGSAHEALNTAPCGTTPSFANLQRLTRSLRASATMMTSLLRPPASPTRFENHADSADVG